MGISHNPLTNYKMKRKIFFVKYFSFSDIEIYILSQNPVLITISNKEYTSLDAAEPYGMKVLMICS